MLIMNDNYINWVVREPEQKLKMEDKLISQFSIKLASIQ